MTTEYMTQQTIVSLLRNNKTDEETTHSYGSTYDILFKPFRDSAKYILEIGIDQGGSLRAWRDYFTSAIIIGFDINDKAIASVSGEQRINAIKVDQRNWRDLVKFSRLQNIKYDIIIDDAIHHIESQVMTRFYMMPEVKPGGLYIVEDISNDQMATMFRSQPNTTVYDLRYIKGRYDDVMAVTEIPI
jgi:2-polyprenyl-3-methyl-5-hydroxy-6-metoxy-1,4-benzoquinol methylase